MKVRHSTWPRLGAFAAGSLLVAAAVINPAQAQQKQPNIVMLMTDDTGWNDFGAYSGGGASLGHPTPNVDQIAKGRCDFHQLVRAGELHRGPCLVLDRASSDPLGIVGRGCPG
jgi:hypothetical protein